MAAIRIDPSKCTGCGLCVTDCLRNVLIVEEGCARLRSDSCFRCGHCVAVCPGGAVSMADCDMGEVVAYDKETFRLNADQLLNAIKFRRSVRQFRPDPVPQADLARILEAGRYTPTGSNTQSVSYVVLQGERVRELEDMALEVYRKEICVGGKLAFMMGYFGKNRTFKPGFFFYHAPAVILAMGKDLIDPSLAMRSMELMADAMGLGTVHIGLFRRAVEVDEEMQALLGVTPQNPLGGVLALGHPAVTYHRTAPRNPVKVTWM